jgi:PAS domain S-box-containing protein
MRRARPHVVCVACSVFRMELDDLQARGEVPEPVEYVDSRLHVDPLALGPELGRAIERHYRHGDGVVLVYGHCHPWMDEQDGLPGTCRVQGVDCPSILLGHELYGELRRAGAFFVLPEWAHRWEETVCLALGADQGAARELLQDMHTHLLYLDTGVTPVPREQLEAASRWSGLPLEIRSVPTDRLASAVREAVERCSPPPDPSRSPALHMMLLSTIEEILRDADDPGQVAATVTDRLRELTGARVVALLPCEHSLGGPGHRALSVCPERRRAAAESREADALARLSHDIAGPELWQAGTPGPATPLLERQGFSSAVAAPLRVGTAQVGVLLMLDLPDLVGAESVLGWLERLTPLLALVLRNSLLFEMQEAMVAQRTRALAEREEQLRATLEASHDGVIAVAADGSIAYANSRFAEMWGLPPEWLSDHSATTLIAALGASLAPRDYPSGLGPTPRGAIGEGVGMVRTADGRSLERVSCSWRVEGEERGRVTSYRDATDRVLLEERLQRSQRLESLGVLAGGIAHDFNNLLSAIMGYTEMTLDDIPLPPEARENLGHVLSGSIRARDLVQQILMFSRKAATELRPLSADAVVREATSFMRASLPATVEIRTLLDPGVGLVLADASQLHQVIVNLCTNAEHAMRGRPGLLTIELVPHEVTTEEARQVGDLVPGPYALLSVTDTGCGIAPSVLERLFEPFFTTKATGEGTGLGLSTCHGIVASHGGAITVESEVGVGTTFRVYLPRIADPEPPVKAT